LDSIRRHAAERVWALREEGQEVLEREVVQRRLRAFEGQLGEAEIRLPVGSLAGHLEDGGSARVDDLDRLPVFRGEEDVKGESAVRRVVLDEDSRLLEWGGPRGVRERGRERESGCPGQKDLRQAH